MPKDRGLRTPKGKGRLMRRLLVIGLAMGAGCNEYAEGPTNGVEHPGYIVGDSFRIYFDMVRSEYNREVYVCACVGDKGANKAHWMITDADDPASDTSIDPNPSGGDNFGPPAGLSDSSTSVGSHGIARTQWVFNGLSYMDTCLGDNYGISVGFYKDTTFLGDTCYEIYYWKRASVEVDALTGRDFLGGVYDTAGNIFAGKYGADVLGEYNHNTYIELREDPSYECIEEDQMNLRPSDLNSWGDTLIDDGDTITFYYPMVAYPYRVWAWQAGGLVRYYRTRSNFYPLYVFILDSLKGDIENTWGRTIDKIPPLFRISCFYLSGVPSDPDSQAMLLVHELGHQAWSIPDGTSHRPAECIMEYGWLWKPWFCAWCTDKIRHHHVHDPFTVFGHEPREQNQEVSR